MSAVCYRIMFGDGTIYYGVASSVRRRMSAHWNSPSPVGERLRCGLDFDLKTMGKFDAWEEAVAEQRRLVGKWKGPWRNLLNIYHHPMWYALGEEHSPDAEGSWPTLKVRLHPSLLDRVKEAAKTEGVTTAALVRRAILAEMDPPPPASSPVAEDDGRRRRHRRGPDRRERSPGSYLTDKPFTSLRRAKGALWGKVFWRATSTTKKGKSQ